MKFTASIVALSMAAGAMAYAKKPTAPQQATINCGAGAGAYCCNNDAVALNQVDCSHTTDNCNSLIICCSNQVQNGASASQACGIDFGDKTVIFS